MEHMLLSIEHMLLGMEHMLLCIEHGTHLAKNGTSSTFTGCTWQKNKQRWPCTLTKQKAKPLPVLPATQSKERLKRDKIENRDLLKLCLFHEINL
jgi:hypothetical protein